MSDTTDTTDTANHKAGEFGRQIVILDRGHVLIGDVTIADGWVVTTDARVIRRWGTTRGLGQLATDGPTSSTVLDHIGIVRSPLRALIGLVAVDGSKWT